MHFHVTQRLSWTRPPRKLRYISIPLHRKIKTKYEQFGLLHFTVWENFSNPWIVLMFIILPIICRGYRKSQSPVSDQRVPHQWKFQCQFTLCYREQVGTGQRQAFRTIFSKIISNSLCPVVTKKVLKRFRVRFLQLLPICKKVKVKLSLCFFFLLSNTPWRRIGEWRHRSTHSPTSALDGGEWSASRPGRFTPQGKIP
jgi:hypothetical protein